MMWAENMNHFYIRDDETLRINKEFIYSHIHSFDKYLLNSCNMQGPTVATQVYRIKNKTAMMPSESNQTPTELINHVLQRRHKRYTWCRGWEV